MTLKRIVVVGSGQAACQLAVSLRQEGYEGAIALIGDEPGLPYLRPPLSKAYMKDGNADRLVLKPAAFYAENGIAVIDRTRVAAIDRDARAVIDEGGSRHAYDHLVLATGARNFRPPIQGVDHGQVMELRTLADARGIRARLGETHRVIVIGGGFIGLEFASVARAAGIDVTVIEAIDRLMGRVVSPEISARFLAAHREAGAEIRFGALAVGIEPDRHGRCAGVALGTGEHLAGDMVLIATGVVPNAELAVEAGLAVENGIVVDETLATCDPAISAIGDCASLPAPSGRRLRLESVQAATDHARHLARRLAKGCAAAYSAVPWFWSDQGPLKLQIAGLTAGADRRVTLPPDGPAEIVASFRAERLVAVETVNAAGAHMAARRLLAHDQGIAFAQVAEAGFDLKSLALSLAPVS